VGKRETHIHDISNTFVPFPQLEVSDRGSDRPSSSYTHSPRLSILSHHPLNLRTTISQLRPPRCIIVTH
jgi:hypothetical protein